MHSCVIYHDMCSSGKSSFGLALFRSRKATQTLICSSFLGTGIMLATYSGYSVTIINLVSIYFPDSSFTLSAQFGLICLKFCLISLEFGS